MNRNDWYQVVKLNSWTLWALCWPFVSALNHFRKPIPPRYSRKMSLIPSSPMNSTHLWHFWTMGYHRLFDVDTAYLIWRLVSAPPVSPLTSFGRDLSSARCHKFNVSHLEDGGQQLEHISDLLLAELHHLQRCLCPDTQGPLHASFDTIKSVVEYQTPFILTRFSLKRMPRSTFCSCLKIGPKPCLIQKECFGTFTWHHSAKELCWGQGRRF